MSKILEMTKGLSLERLQTLCLVAEKGGISAAAGGDPNRQSLFSRQMRDLELVFGRPILDRNQVPHQLTEFGVEVEAAARHFLSELHRLTTVGKGQKRSVTIGAGESIIQFLLMPKVVAAGGKLEGLSVHFRNLTGRMAREQVRKERIEIAVAHAVETSAGLSSETFRHYGLRLVSRSPVENSRGVVGWKVLAKLEVAALEGDGTWQQAVAEVAPRGWWGNALKIGCTTYGQVIEATKLPGLCGLVPDFLIGQRAETSLFSYGIEAMEREERELRVYWRSSSDEYHPEIAEVVKCLRSARRTQSADSE